MRLPNEIRPPTRFIPAGIMENEIFGHPNFDHWRDLNFNEISVQNVSNFLNSTSQNEE